MNKLPKIWKLLNENVSIIGTNISRYPVCYTTDLAAALGKYKLPYKQVCASGSDADKTVALEKCIMELVERVVFLKVMDKEYRLLINGVTSKGWACHYTKAQAREHARLEFYEDFCAKNFCILSGSLEKEAHDPLSKSDFNFALVHMGSLFFSAVWFMKGDLYSLGTACDYNSAMAYKKSLQEAYVKWKANLCTHVKGTPLPFRSGYFESDIILPEPRLDEVEDSLLDALQLYVFRARPYASDFH